MNQFSNSFSPILKQKHKIGLQQLRLKSLTVDARKTFILSQPHSKKQILTPITNKRSQNLEIFINGKGQSENSPTRRFRRRQNNSEYKAASTIFTPIPTTQRNQEKSGVESMFTIRKYQLIKK